jgi:periplasmic protein TonB
MLTLAHDSTIPNPHRGWATLTSFAVQATAVAVLFVIPLIHPGLVPHLDLTPRLVPIFLPHVSAPTVHPTTSAQSETPQIPNILTVPREIPHTIDTRGDQKPGDPEAPCVQCVPASSQNTIPGGFDVINITPTPSLPKLAPKPPRISAMMDGYLTHRIQPTYPPMAKQARIQGPVEIAALISKQGTIENLQVLSGHPMLIAAALDAVKQWRYRPYVLNGDPIEVNTKITVTFILGGN